MKMAIAALAMIALVAMPLAAAGITVKVGLNGDTYYVGDSGAWHETNGCDDLQTGVTFCNPANDIVNEDGSITEVEDPSDEPVVA